MKLFFLLSIFFAHIVHLAWAQESALPEEYRRDGTIIRDLLDPIQEKIQDHTAVFFNAKTGKQFIYGVVMSTDGFLLTKASELMSIPDFTVRIEKKHYRNPEVIAHDHRWDLSLVKVEATDLKSVMLGSSEGLERGTWVVSNSSTTRRTRRVRPGIISANSREAKGPILVVMGIRMSLKDGKVLINEVIDGSGAADAALLRNDVIDRVNGVEITKPDDLLDIIREKNPGERIDVLVDRSEKKYSCQLELKPRHDVYERELTRNESMSGMISHRRDNFPRVLQHDTTVNSRTVGGPLMTLDGVCIGMNIASASRVAAFAIPAEELQVAYAELKEKAEK